MFPWHSSYDARQENTAEASIDDRSPGRSLLDKRYGKRHDRVRMARVQDRIQAYYGTCDHAWGDTHSGYRHPERHRWSPHENLHSGPAQSMEERRYTVVVAVVAPEHNKRATHSQR